MYNEEEKACFSEFGRILGTRQYSENNLSNFTYATLKSIPGFKKDFINYFLPFDAQIEHADGIEVKRELEFQKVDRSFGRADLHFSAPEWKLLLENKIDDRNYRFEDYRNDKSNTYYGLITNHEVIGVPENWINHTWREFLNNFEYKQYGNQTGLFNMYIEYVREVCSLKKLQKFYINNEALYSLYNFINMAEITINSIHTDRYISRIYSSYKSFYPNWAGYYFTLEQKMGATLWPYFGIFYGEKEVTICVTIENNRSIIEEKHFKMITERIGHVADTTKFNIKFIKDAGEIHLCCNPEIIKQLNISEVEKQKEILKEFVIAACDTLLFCIEDNKDDI